MMKFYSFFNWGVIFIFWNEYLGQVIVIRQITPFSDQLEILTRECRISYALYNILW
jgi:hypothetical protein